jgi:hydrogenase nickel incorporation protein HypB
MVHEALHRLDLQGVDLLFIENVGNLVCPASFDLGQHRNVTLLSVPEGDDKPAKYPVMFRAADLVLCTKSDLLPVLPEFQPQRAERYLRELASVVPFERVSTRGDGELERWLHWLQQELVAHRARLELGRSIRPAIQPDGARLHGEPVGAAASGHHHHHEHAGMHAHPEGAGHHHD